MTPFSNGVLDAKTPQSPLIVVKEGGKKKMLKMEHKLYLKQVSEKQRL
jgi:hypothetical protein